MMSWLQDSNLLPTTTCHHATPHLAFEKRKKRKKPACYYLPKVETFTMWWLVGVEEGVWHSLHHNIFLPTKESLLPLHQQF